jgi:hypothetical protein
VVADQDPKSHRRLAQAVDRPGLAWCWKDLAPVAQPVPVRAGELGLVAGAGTPVAPAEAALIWQLSIGPNFKVEQTKLV